MVNINGTIHHDHNETAIKGTTADNEECYYVMDGDNFR